MDILYERELDYIEHKYKPSHALLLSSDFEIITIQ